MIHINLLPGNQKRKGRQAQTSTKGAAYFGIMALGWSLLGAGGYWMLVKVEDETQKLRADTKKNRDRAEEIRKMIDEEALLARQKKVADLRAAIEALNQQRRSPVFVMHEISNILTTGKMPDIDEEKQRRLESTDPMSRLNPAWDASSVWLSGLDSVDGTRFRFSGSTRDPADLDEFLKRMRSSVRFSRVTHPKFDAKVVSKRGSKSSQQSRHYSFSFEATVAFWD